MAANYTLVSSQSTIQVISPTVVQDVVVLTIQTHPSGVIASCWVTEKEWKKGNTAEILTGYAANIEKVMASPHVEDASGGNGLDPSGLLASEITFTVGYEPPGSPFPPATVDVTVLAKTLLPSVQPTFGDVSASGRSDGGADAAPPAPAADPGVLAALAKIDAAYTQLAAAAGA